jgi:hypothetical protein
MRYLKWSTRSLIIVVTLVLVGGVLAGMSLWQATANKDAIAAAEKQNYHKRIQRGLGSSVKFASPGDSPDQILASVESVNSFIHRRANLGMSEETRERLAQIEGDALKNGASRRINAKELTDAITDLLAQRVASLSDRDIEFAGRALGKGGDLMLRANGRYAATKEEFKSMARSFREQSRAGGKGARDAIQMVIEEEVKGRLADFSEAVPDKFERAKDEGVTPLQALLITYSVLADDRLEEAPEDLEKSASELAKRTGKKAYGVNGYRFSTPVNLVFNKETSKALLDRFEKGGASR